MVSLLYLIKFKLNIKLGASPFLENAAGYTPLDFAMNKRDVRLVRNMEKLALFSNYLNVKVNLI